MSDLEETVIRNNEKIEKKLLASRKLVFNVTYDSASKIGTAEIFQDTQSNNYYFVINGNLKSAKEMNYMGALDTIHMLSKDVLIRQIKPIVYCDYNAFENIEYSGKLGKFIYSPIDFEISRHLHGEEELYYCGFKDSVVIPDGCTNIYKTFSNLKTKNFAVAGNNKITDVDEAFEGASIDTLDLRALDMNGVTSMYGMFQSSKIEEITFPQSTIKADSLSCVFMDCYDLDKIDFNGAVFPNIKNATNLFMNCYSLPKVDLSSINLKDISEAIGMFEECHNLDTIVLENEEQKNDLLSIKRTNLNKYIRQKNIVYNSYEEDIER